MAMRLAPRAIVDKAPPVKAKAYLQWIRCLPCLVSGSQPVEAAHVSFANPAFGAHGRGKGQKASDRWAVPLSPDLHREQHTTNERDWWSRKDINPHLIATILWGLWNERGELATSEAVRIIRSKAFLAAPSNLSGD